MSEGKLLINLRKKIHSLGNQGGRKCGEIKNTPTYPKADWSHWKVYMTSESVEKVWIQHFNSFFIL